MSDSNRGWKWALVAVLICFSMFILYPPSQKLKGGIDLVGGTSLLFEIDTTGLEPADQRDLSDRVMRILRERVDPQAQLNLEWRPVGNTRLEIRMPRPPKKALERRAVYNDALEAIKARNLARFDVERALNATGEDRASLLKDLEHGMPERATTIEAVTSAYDEYVSSQATGDTNAIKEASDKYEQAMAQLLATNLPVRRVEDVLALGAGSKRAEELARMRAEYPSFDAGGEGAGLISRAVTAYDAWSKNKADLEDPSDLKRLLRGAGVLEFRILAERDPNNPEQTRSPVTEPISKYIDHLAKFGPRPRAEDHYIWIPVEDVFKFTRAKTKEELDAQKSNPNFPIFDEYAGRYYVLMHDDPEYKMVKGTGAKAWSLREAYPDRDPMTGQNVVSFRLDPRGGSLFGELTGSNVDRDLCIVLDGAAMSYARINERITERGQIKGNFPVDKVQELVRILEAGSLPARLKETPLMENTIGPSLGETNRERGVRGALYGLIAVIIFMLFYYGISAGGMADVALLLNLLFVLGIMALLQATFTVPGIAGLILTIGMAVDANVLIFERVREERDRGVPFRRALNAGYDKAFSTIFDSNLTTLITCIILGTVGSEEVKGFAITLGIGICTSMFTALFVTRMVFNTLIEAGWLKDFSMRRIIGVPQIDWMGLRRSFWPVSGAMVAGGALLFIGMSTTNTERLFDIEFLGGTSLQIDLKPGVARSDEEVESLITAPSGRSAATWLAKAADQLEAALPAPGEAPGQFTLTSPDLTADELGALMRAVIENRVERGGIRGLGRMAIFDGKPGALDLSSFKTAIADAAAYARASAFRLQSARVQRVGEGIAEQGLSYEIVTIETNRDLVQAAVLDTLGDDLAVQQQVTFTTVIDEELTKEPFFVVEGDDQYLSDVIGGDATFDIRRFRGGAAVAVHLDPEEMPLPVDELDRRLREIGLHPEFEQYRAREYGIYPLDAAAALIDGRQGYRRFAILTVDDAFRFDENPDQWLDSLARPHLAKIEAALGQEKSFSKVVQFAPQVAGQTRNRATFAIVLSLFAVVAYLWLRFGTKEYGLAAIVALVHDVAVTLGFVTITHFVYNNVLGRVLLLEPIRVDLSMIAAVLTVIGYSLNDTIVIFDRIRENKGRIGELDARTINSSINQTMSRTILTGLTTLIVLLVLYAMGGKAVHGFSFALLIGVIVGTYSSVAIAAPLIYKPRVLHAVAVVIATLAAILVVYELTTPRWPEARMILIGLSILTGAYALWRLQRGASEFVSGRVVNA